MGIFNNNKDSKRAAENRAYDENQPGSGMTSNDPDRVSNTNTNYNNTVNDDRAYADNNTGRSSHLAQNNQPGTGLTGNQYQDPYADQSGRHPGHHGMGTNNSNVRSDLTNTTGEPGYSNTGVQAGTAGQTLPANVQGGHHLNHPGAGTAAGVGATTAAAGYAAGGHTGTGANPAGNPDYYNPTEAQLQAQTGQIPTKSNIRKQEYMGKLENAAGVLLSSEGMKARGAQKEAEALAMKRQANELTNAQRFEQDALRSRHNAVAHGAHPHHAGLSAAGQPGAGTVGSGPMQQPGGTTTGMPGNNVGGRY